MLTPSPDAELPPCRAAVRYLRAGLDEGVRRLRAEHGIRSLLCEGGPALLGDLVRAGLVDALALVIAPELVARAGPADDPGGRGDASRADPLELGRCTSRAGTCSCATGSIRARLAPIN